MTRTIHLRLTAVVDAEDETRCSAECPGHHEEADDEGTPVMAMCRRYGFEELPWDDDGNPIRLPACLAAAREFDDDSAGRLREIRDVLGAAGYVAEDPGFAVATLVGIASRVERQESEMAALRADLAREQALRREAEAAFLACAEAIGVVYEADGHASAPGPVDEVVRCIHEAWKASLPEDEHDLLEASQRRQVAQYVEDKALARAHVMHRRAQAAESRAIKAERQAEAQRKRADREMAERHKREALWGASIMSNETIPPTALEPTDGGNRQEERREASLRDILAEASASAAKLPASVVIVADRNRALERHAVAVEGTLPYRSTTACDICDEDPCVSECAARQAEYEARTDRMIAERDTNATTRFNLRIAKAAVASLDTIASALACSPDNVVEAVTLLVAAHEACKRERDGDSCREATSIAVMNEAELRAVISSQSTAIYDLRVELEEAKADAATSMIAATEALARAERAEAERDALRMRVAKAESDLVDSRNQSAEAHFIADGLRKERDALKAKVERVRAYAEAVAMRTDASMEERYVAMSAIKRLDEEA
jgi:hypothetical protein